MQKTLVIIMPLPNIAELEKLLSENDFGSITECDSDPDFVNTVSDSHRILQSIIATGESENNILFKRPVGFYITDSAIIQATAVELDDIDTIFLTEGLITSIRRSVCKLLSEDDTFMPSGTKNTKDKSKRVEDDQSLLPLCHERREFANGIIQRALEFVFIHELSHIFYGHHAYLRKIYPSAYQFPLLMSQPQNANMQKQKLFRIEINADRHAMEIQADRYAADVTLMLAFRELWGQQLEFWSGSDNILKSLEKRAVQELGAVLAIVFNIVDSINSEFHTHPHPKFRWLAAMMSALTVWTSTFRVKSKKPYMNPDEFLNLFNATNVDTNDAWRRAGMPSIGSIADLKERDFRDLLERAIRLFPKLDSRFDKQHVI